MGLRLTWLPGIDQLKARLEDIATDASARVVEEHLGSKGAQIRVRSRGLDGRGPEAAPEHQLHELEGAEKPLLRSPSIPFPTSSRLVHSVLNVLEVFC